MFILFGSYLEGLSTYVNEHDSNFFFKKHIPDWFTYV
jgi:hypothetical protein